MLKIPTDCLRLLAHQRSDYLRIIEREFGAEIFRTYRTFASLLPKNCKRILDIGSGMAAIDLELLRHYKNGVYITLLDVDGEAEKIKCGWHASADAFSAYNSFDAAKKLLAENGADMSKIITCDISHESFPVGPFDVIISLLSWGFHYPVKEYIEQAKANLASGGVLLMDVRKGTDGIQQLSAAFSKVRIVHRSERYVRIAAC